MSKAAYHVGYHVLRDVVPWRFELSMDGYARRYFSPGPEQMFVMPRVIIDPPRAMH